MQTTKQNKISMMKYYEDSIALILVTIFLFWQREILYPVDIALLYLLPVLFAAIRRGKLAAFIVSLISITLFSFFFEAPRYGYVVSHIHYFLIFLTIVAVGQIVARLSDDAKKAKELEISEITKDTILSLLSHEIKTPLSAVMGASSSLLEPTLKMDEETKKELLLSIHDGSIRIQNLIESLLNMARLEDGKLVPNKSRIEASEIIGTVIGKFDYETASSIQLIDSSNKELECDIKLIELALFNILENAVKYGSNIQIELKEESRFVLFVVSNDTNLNNSYDLSDIFMKFTRLPNAASASGVGLGLSICKAITDIHKGKISANMIDNRFIIKLYIPWN